MPDRVISVPQATQIATRIKNKFDTVNGRLQQEQTAIGVIETALGKENPSANLLDISAFEDGYYSSGEWTDSSDYMTSDYIPLENAENVYLHLFNLNNGSKQDTSRYIQYIYWFDSGKNYLNRTQTTSGVTEYEVLSGAIYFRVMVGKTTFVGHLANNKGFYVGTEDTETWIEHTDGAIPNYVEIIRSIRAAVSKPKLSLLAGVYTIDTAKARYTFRRITESQYNLDTFRLYSGMLVNDDGAFTMWSNSDAEGAIRIQGETDYVSGFHGSEVMTAFKVFMDGADITSETSIDSDFDTLMFYVESDVYHCYQDTAVAETVAFKRCKIVSFSGNKVTVSNSYIPQETLTITSARIALFQCYKSDGNTPVFTDLSVNTDFKNYPVSTIATSKPSDSDKMTEAILHTAYGRIRFKSILTSGQSYKGNVTDFASQNRVKVYFDTISRTSEIQTGEQIMSQFEFEVA